LFSINVKLIIIAC